MVWSSAGLASTTDCPSTSTSPRSGRMRPMVVLSRTLLPVPDGPTMERVSPLATVRSTPVRTGTSKALYTSRYSIAMASVQEERREEGVGDQHGDDHEDHGGGGGAAHALRAPAGQQAHVHGDHRDHEAEGQGLQERIEQVVAVP